MEDQYLDKAQSLLVDKKTARAFDHLRYLSRTGWLIFIVNITTELLLYKFFSRYKIKLTLLFISLFHFFIRFLLKRQPRSLRKICIIVSEIINLNLLYETIVIQKQCQLFFVVFENFILLVYQSFIFTNTFEIFIFSIKQFIL